MSLCKEVQWTHKNEWEFLEKEKKKKTKCTIQENIRWGAEGKETKAKAEH